MPITFDIPIVRTPGASLHVTCVSFMFPLDDPVGGPRPPQVDVQYIVQAADGETLPSEPLTFEGPPAVAFLRSAVPAGKSLGSYIKERVFAALKAKYPQYTGTEDTTIADPSEIP